ncbi:MAG TPA: hypothetical protein VHF47_14680 [Acidimicrobiales bacterium]|nr:hypothetical protein [Acidimicrobiales bacterium]
MELGVSGWGATHQTWAIDPEPLIVFTAWLGDRDTRLRDEATDWCIRYSSRLSRVRLKNLVNDQPHDVQKAFGTFAATVSHHAGVTWPRATTKRPFRVTGKSTLPPLDRPSLAWLRLRALFGLGARTEVLRYFLSHPGASASAAWLANWSGYAKRVVADACEMLHQAGELRMRTIGNRFAYSLAPGALVEGFEGLPPVLPNWTAVCNVARELAELEAQRSSVKTLPVKVKRTLAAIEDDLDDVDAEAPESARGHELWPAVVDLDRRTLRRWAVGRWTA